MNIRRNELTGIAIAASIFLIALTMLVMIIRERVGEDIDADTDPHERVTVSDTTIPSAAADVCPPGKPTHQLVCPGIYSKTISLLVYIEDDRRFCLHTGGEIYRHTGSHTRETLFKSFSAVGCKLSPVEIRPLGGSK